MDVWLDLARDWVRAARLGVNEACAGLESVQLILVTVGVTLVLTSIYWWLTEEHQYTFTERVRYACFNFVRSLPPVKRRVKEKIVKTTKEVEDGYNRNSSEEDKYLTVLPAGGYGAEKTLSEALRYKSQNKADWEGGRVSGTVYGGDRKLTEVMAKVFAEFAWTNPLHPDVFLDIRRMEAEGVRMCCDLFNGDADSCGTMTSGGTESIILACLAYRNMALERGVKFPEIVAASTVHAAFDKAAQYLRMRITHVPVDPVTCRADVAAMRRAIGRQTCMLVGSAPSFPHGIIDDLDAIQKLGLRYNIPVHVDCCLGGFLLPFMEKAGFPMPAYDFRLPGVTSISCDTHKYGFAPKGSSLILYRDNKYRMYQICVVPDWSGGIYATPTIPGSRPGVIIAQCWAALVYHGVDGYVESTRKIITTTRKIRDGLKQLEPDLKLFGDPQMSILGIGSDRFDVYRLFEMLTNRGWCLNVLQFPSSFHLCCTMPHTKPGVAEHFLEDTRIVVGEIMKNPEVKSSGMGSVYGSSQAIPDRSMVAEAAAHFITALYTTGGSKPGPEEEEEEEKGEEKAPPVGNGTSH